MTAYSETDTHHSEIVASRAVACRHAEVVDNWNNGLGALLAQSVIMVIISNFMAKTLS